MNQKLKDLLNIIQQSKKLDAEQKANLFKAVKDVDKELEITSFKLERTEKVKKTTAILLEETIEELEQKRKAVEKQNRNLEIEAALERVRTTAMGMQKREDMIKICKTISQQLKKLGINEIRNIQTAIFYPNKGTYMNYEYYAKHNKTFITDVSYKTHRVQHSFAQKMMKGKGEFEHKQFKEKKLHDWYTYQKTTNQFADKYLLKADSLNYYWYSLGVVAIGISTYKPLLKKEQKLFIRFRNVFELAYRRYLDIEKSEAQAREAQIELTLERVRARTMAMQHSDELAEVSSLLFEQMEALGIQTYSSGFTIWDEKQDDLVSWICNADGSMNPPFRMPIEEEKWHKEQYESWKKDEEFIVKDLKGEKIQSYFRYLRSFPLLDEAFKKSIATGHPMPERQVHHVANFSHGNLLFITLEPRPEAHDIFKRFAKVFEQTYTRFLDLQKAEAQARESQIEAALERVRARSMGMHKSNELKDVVRLLYKEFRILVTDIHSVNIQLKLDSSKDIHFWASVEEDIYPELYHIPYSDLPIFEKFYNAFNSPGEGFLDYLLNKEEKDAFFSEVFKIQPVPPQRKKMIQNAEGMVMTGWFHKHSGIDILRYNLKRFSEEEKEIVKRFAAAFEQTYIRFLDLQKAEAQAREAQIEAALERVRSRSLAMHNSEEIKDVVITVMEKMNELKIEMNGGVSLATFIEDSEDLLHWYVNPDHVEGPVTMHLPYFDNILFHDFVKARKEGRDLFLLFTLLSKRMSTLIILLNTPILE